MAQNIEHLANLAFVADLGEARLGEVADLVLRLHQKRARRNGALLTHAQQRPYSALAETERLGMRSAVQEVLNALLLLDIVELRR